MLSCIFEIMPLFIVRIIAKKKCEAFNIQKGIWVGAREDVLIRLFKPVEDPEAPNA